MIRFWIAILVICGIATGILMLSSPTSNRWPRWIATIWIAIVLLTAILVIASAIYHW